MLKKVTYITVVVLMAMFLLPAQSQAIGIGVYLPAVASGTSTWTAQYDYGDFDFDNDFSGDGGFGFVLDTRVARNGLFNYRLNIGLQNATYSYEGSDQDGYKIYVLDNTFGFGVVRTRFMRIWVGPQVRLAGLNWSDDETDLSAFGFGLAPVVGANFNFGRMLTAAIDVGYLFTSYAGVSETSNSYGSSSVDFTISQQVFFLNLSFLFRINDVFERAHDQDDEKADYSEEYY